MLAGLRQQQTAASVDDLTRKAEEMARRQQESNDKLRRAYGAPGQQPGEGVTRQQAEELAREKEQLANDYQGLESDMGKAVRDSAGTNRQLSNKLRETLGQVSQNRDQQPYAPDAPTSCDAARGGRPPCATPSPPRP